MSNIDSRYLLDTNVFVQAYRTYYAFDLAPLFWEELTRCARQGSVRSVDRVLEEINRRTDRLTDWVNNEFQKWFEDTHQSDVVSSYIRILKWMHTKNYTSKGKADFAEPNNADPWIVAYAHSKGFVVVTEEKIDHKIKRRIPIPNVCLDFDVEYINTFDMMRKLAIVFK